LKSTTLELESQGRMLQETMDNWNTYEKFYGQLDEWLTEGERILQRSDEDKLVS